MLFPHPVLTTSTHSHRVKPSRLSRWLINHSLNQRASGSEPFVCVAHRHMCIEGLKLQNSWANTCGEPHPLPVWFKAGISHFTARSMLQCAGSNCNTQILYVAWTLRRAGSNAPQPVCTAAEFRPECATRNVCAFLCVCVCVGEVNHWPLASDESSHQLGWPLPPAPLLCPLPPLFFAPSTLTSAPLSWPRLLSWAANVLTVRKPGEWELVSMSRVTSTDGKFKKCWGAERRGWKKKTKKCWFQQRLKVGLCQTCWKLKCLGKSKQCTCNLLIVFFFFF